MTTINTTFDFFFDIFFDTVIGISERLSVNQRVLYACFNHVLTDHEHKQNADGLRLRCSRHNFAYKLLMMFASQLDTVFFLLSMWSYCVKLTLILTSETRVFDQELTGIIVIVSGRLLRFFHILGERKIGIMFKKKWQH